MSIDRIITARDYSAAEGADGSVRDRVLKMRDRIRMQRGITLEIHNIDAPQGAPVVARIWQGQWIADCPDCAGAQFVEPGEPIYYCFGCANRSNGYSVRPVEFPPEDQRQEIERLLLERPVNDMAGLTDLERVGLSKPILTAQIVATDGQIQTVSLARNWNPGETVNELYAQNEPVRAWLQTQQGGG